MVHLAVRDRVELLRWPEQAGRRAELACRGTPRLLLVKQGTAPPDVANRARNKALGSRVHRLRQRLGPLGLSVYSIRSRGFLLAASENTQET